MVNKRVVAIMAIALSTIHRMQSRSRIASKRRRKIWVKNWIKKRSIHGAYHQLMKELSCLDVSGYRNFVRMDSTSFETLIKMVWPKVKRQDTVMRKAISPGERLAITLCFLYISDPIIGGLIKSTEKVSNELDILESHEHVNSSIVLRR